MVKGKLLMWLGANKYLTHIVLFFMMAIAFIGANLYFESTIHKKEENKKIIENLKSAHTFISCELTSLDSVCQVEDMLKSRGSNVQIPRKQAVKVK